MKSTYLRAAAKRLAAAGRNRRHPLQLDRDVPEQPSLRNYFIKIGNGHYLLSCAARPDPGLGAQLEKRDAARLEQERLAAANKRARRVLGRSYATTCPKDAAGPGPSAAVRATMSTSSMMSTTAAGEVVTITTRGRRILSADEFRRRMDSDFGRVPSGCRAA